jgi:transcriptional regulator with XRE-family HTH domain
MSNIISGRQLRAARILAGLTQKQFTTAVGVDERAVRYWELKENKLPTSVPDSLEQIEAALRCHGVVVFLEPTPGARLADFQHEGSHLHLMWSLTPLIKGQMIRKAGRVSDV